MPPTRFSATRKKEIRFLGVEEKPGASPGAPTSFTVFGGEEDRNPLGLGPRDTGSITRASDQIMPCGVTVAREALNL